MQLGILSSEKFFNCMGSTRENFHICENSEVCLHLGLGLFSMFITGLGKCRQNSSFFARLSTIVVFVCNVRIKLLFPRNTPLLTLMFYDSVSDFHGSLTTVLTCLT